ARLGPEHHATAAPQRRLERTRARATGALLTPRLFIRAGNFPNILCASGAHPLIGLVRYDHVMDGLRAAPILDERHLDVVIARFLALQIFNRNLHFRILLTS